MPKIFKSTVFSVSKKVSKKHPFNSNFLNLFSFLAIGSFILENQTQSKLLPFNCLQMKSFLLSSLLHGPKNCKNLSLTFSQHYETTNPLEKSYDSFKKDVQIRMRPYLHVFFSKKMSVKKLKITGLHISLFNRKKILKSRNLRKITTDSGAWLKSTRSGLILRAKRRNLRVNKF